MLLRVNEQKNIIHEIIKRKANWIGHILRRNCLLKQVIEGKIKGQIKVTRRQGRSRKKLLDDLNDRRGYCELKEEALDRTMWRNRFARGFGPVVWQILMMMMTVAKRLPHADRKQACMSVQCTRKYVRLKHIDFLFYRNIGESLNSQCKKAQLVVQCTGKYARFRWVSCLTL